jgi:cell fate regulator YaaT (PSP1 superfamily)
MIKVAGIRFKKAGKVYFFDPDGFSVTKGVGVIVETARGLEYGVLSDDIKEVDEKEIVAPLKKIIRIAEEKDILQHQENLKKKEHDLALCQEKVDKHKLNMKLVDVEHTFDNSKIIFYFTADGRVDFRELVKDLAGVFKMRIELRQIGVRDEAKLIGGIGTCGKALCCHSWLPEFEPVSIKMAKVQNLSLNPTKISGTCGRLMCCLKYENDVYCQLRKGMPDVGEKIKTVEGMAIVIETNILENRIKVRHIVEEKGGEGPEKLSTDIITYNKQQIKRLGSKKDNDFIDDEIDASLLNEIKTLLQD